jgi:cob(I)alamin adenosyltransferase
MSSKVYTKTGDKGETSLVGGQRVSKAAERIDIYGELDELNSYLGLALSYNDILDGEELDYLKSLQSLLFDLGSNMASLKADRLKFKLPAITDAHVSAMERHIDEMNKSLSPLKNFIMPGGDSMAAALHVCRTVTRRIERKMVHFSNENVDELETSYLIFMNRMSDYFFVCARYVNHLKGVTEECWVTSS